MEEKKQIEIKDFLDFRYVSNPTFSPDGNCVAFIVTTIDREKDAYTGDLWLLDVNTKEVLRLTEQAGIKLYFFTKSGRLCAVGSKLSEGGSDETVFCEIFLNGEAPKELFRIPMAVSSIKMVDETTYAFTAVHDNCKSERNKGYEVLEEAPFWYNGRGFTSERRKGLYLFHRDSGEIDRISELWSDVGNYEICNGRLAYQAIPWQNYLEYPYSPAIYTYDLKSKEHRLCMEVNTFNNFEMTFWKENELLLSGLKGVPGKGMGQNADFYTLNLDTGNVKLFAKMDRIIGFNGSGSDAKYGGGRGSVLRNGEFYFISPMDDGSCLNKIDKTGQITTRLSDSKAEPAAYSVESFDVYRDQMILCKMERSALAELYLNGEQVTHFNDEYLESHDVREPEYHSFTASDGFEIHGWCMKPRGYTEGQSYPAILHIHGGPKTVFGDIYHHEMQMWANAGYFVIYCNPRGSDGRGTKFADINGKWGTVDYDNLMEFTDEMLSAYADMDPKRVAVCGGSYGGYMTNWIIGQTDRFSAACSQRSMSNLIDFEYLSDIGHTSILSEHMTTVEEDMERLWKESPLKYAPNCTTPTLFIQSDEDYRCYMTDALAEFACLKRHGCKAKMCLFHGENHELSRSGKPSNRISRMKEILDWFDEYLK